MPIAPSPFEERIDGETFLRMPPPPAHERLVVRLHAWVASQLPANSIMRLLPPRSPLVLGEEQHFRPDLQVVRRDNGRPWLVAEVLSPTDHLLDTGPKKSAYQTAAGPRLWIVDPRYYNVEVYAPGEHGFRLEAILAHRDRLGDPCLPQPGPTMLELFAAT